MTKFAGYDIQDSYALLHDFGTNSVAREDSNVQFHIVPCLVCLGRIRYKCHCKGTKIFGINLEM